MKKPKDGILIHVAGREWAKHLRRDGKKAASKAARRNAKLGA